jgi:dephospho-CoA kinase
MKIIGLTGGIGSGKSAVASLLKELGAAVIDSDRVGHEVLNPGTPGWSEVVKNFGREILATDGAIDRRKLAGVVFNNPEALRKLNRIVHPRIENEVKSRLQTLREQKADVVVIEAALIGEAGWTSLAEQIWVVKSAPQITLKRLKERGVSEAEARARMAAQKPAEEQVQHRLVIINNDGSLEDLKAGVKILWRKLFNEASD